MAIEILLGGPARWRRLAAAALGAALGFAGAALAGIGPAAAADGDDIDFTVSGFIVGAVGFVDQDDDDGTRSTVFGTNGELHFGGSRTLDNGLIVGATIQFELEDDGKADGENADDDVVDEFKLYFQSGFGRAEFGQDDGAGNKMSYAAPTVALAGYVSEQDFFDIVPRNPGTPEIDTVIDLSHDDLKLTAFTPRLMGVQAGLSYAPEPEKPATGFGDNRDNEPGEFGDVIEFGLNYIETFDEVDLTLSGAYAAGTLEQGLLLLDDDPEQWQLGANLGFAGFTLGAGYRNDNDASTTSDKYSWDAGVSYVTGPWQLGALYGKATREFDGALSGTADNETTAVEVAANYLLGPGIRVGVGYTHWDFDIGSETPGTLEDNAADVVFLETALSF